jgi:ATP-binding cassette subfamily C (CFTR/MRP) protein 4
MIILGALIVPIIINPWIIVPLIPLAIVFYFLQNYFISTARELKRLENIGSKKI